MVADDRRIAWLLAAETLERGRVEARASLSVVAEAGFRTVAMSASTSADAIGRDLEEEAKRMGLQCILLEDSEYYRLSAALGEAQRRAQASALSRDGFDGFILCASSDSRIRAESLLAAARALLRDLDQRDWESYH